MLKSRKPPAARPNPAARASSPGSLWRKLGIPDDYATRRHLPLQREATTLVPIGRNPDGRRLRLAPRAAGAWRRMRAAAAADGCLLLPISAFRSISRQGRIIRAKLASGERLSRILKFVAAPGCSEHHTGCALDLGSPAETALEVGFCRTAEFRWLEENAARFGFHLSYPRGNRHGIGYEPWHWRWRSRTRRDPGSTKTTGKLSAKA